jgi:nitrogen fixation/metabolism regulation signal transduction histidine kinase
MALGAGLPGILSALVLLWGPDRDVWGNPWIVTAVIVVPWIFLAAVLRRRIVFPLQTVSNLVAALRENDFSFRSRYGRGSPHDTLEELSREVNTLADTLQEQRLRAVEATALLQKVMEEIGVAVFAFDSERRLKLVNRAAEALLNLPAGQAAGQTAESLGLAEYLENEATRLLDATFPGGTGRWEIRRTEFRQEGRPHQLLVISDLTRALREEELLAWQRIVRVIGHEINNSLAPIKSIAGSLQSNLAKPDRAQDWEEDLTHGLSIIESRSEALGRFMAAYAQLARLPQPQRKPVEIGALADGVRSLETRINVAVEAAPPVNVSADPDLIEQVLINLVRNAADAALQTGGNVTIRWKVVGKQLELQIEDEGAGIANPSNLFVPFFTTKPGGSGIGLVLSRQIVEAHGGSLCLENRVPGPGSVARIRLPL